ncbi:MAG TPA: SOS response-associated peptidase [Elusimicrobiota bacterium]|nr:SOS response-associated peptidase [Elusimicrobiota bacterium]
MCARYTATVDPKKLGERFGIPPAPGLKPRYNVAPSQEAAVVIAAPEPRMSLLRWGLLPAWAKGPQAKPQINARAETLADKPFFRESFRWRRALVPADGWFEWPKKGADKAPRFFRLKGGEPFAFAGLWESGGFALVTVEPNPLVARFHDRMPAVLARGDETEWLDAKTRPERLRELLLPYPAELLVARRVGSRIGRTDVDEPSLLDEESSSQGDLFGAV